MLAMSRWNIQKTKKSIEWIVEKGKPHSEDLEMSGLSISHTVKYGVDAEGAFFIFIIPPFPPFAVVRMIHMQHINWI